MTWFSHNFIWIINEWNARARTVAKMVPSGLAWHVYKWIYDICMHYEFDPIRQHQRAMLGFQNTERQQINLDIFLHSTLPRPALSGHSIPFIIIIIICISFFDFHFSCRQFYFWHGARLASTETGQFIYNLLNITCSTVNSTEYSISNVLYIREYICNWLFRSAAATATRMCESMQRKQNATQKN